MITEELWSIWSSPVGHFTVESISAPQAAQQVRIWAFDPDLFFPLRSNLGPAGCTAGFEEVRTVFLDFWFWNLVLLRLCVSIFCALTPFHSISSGGWLEL